MARIHQYMQIRNPEARLLSMAAQLWRSTIRSELPTASFLSLNYILYKEKFGCMADFHASTSIVHLFRAGDLQQPLRAVCSESSPFLRKKPLLFPIDL